jgi:hypothetical protein
MTPRAPRRQDHPKRIHRQDVAHAMFISDAIATPEWAAGTMRNSNSSSARCAIAPAN